MTAAKTIKTLSNPAQLLDAKHRDVPLPWHGVGRTAGLIGAHVGDAYGTLLAHGAHLALGATGTSAVNNSD